MTPADVRALVADLVDAVGSVIVDKTEEVTAAVICLLARGHLLLEDLPGTGKTMLARSLAVASGGEFRRIQATPDLLPNDVTGVNVFDPRTSEFAFRPGPVFANVVLADEINRATPRTQSALLEAMAERQVTVDGETRSLPAPFMVVATQNPVEFEGTFPLPEAQLDRFLMSMTLGYPGEVEEAGLVQSITEVHPIEALSPITGPDSVRAAQSAVAACTVEDEIARLIVSITTGTRRHPGVSLPASPRASLALGAIARAAATADGRDYVTPHDVKRFARVSLAHRIALTPDARLRGASASAVVDEVIEGLSMGVRDVDR